MLFQKSGVKRYLQILLTAYDVESMAPGYLICINSTHDMAKRHALKPARLNGHLVLVLPRSKVSAIEPMEQ